MSGSSIRNVAMLAVLAVAGVASASSNYSCSAYGYCYMPCVSSSGNMSWTQKTYCYISGTYKYKYSHGYETGTIVCTGKCNVYNHSGKSHTYTNCGLCSSVLSCLSGGYTGSASTDTYTCTKAGCGTYTGSYNNCCPCSTSSSGS